MRLNLDLAKNVFGNMPAEYKREIVRYCYKPTEKQWDIIAHYIVGGRNLVTLWQAVIAVNPGFPRTGRCYKGNRIFKKWASIPAAEEIEQAINYATH
jgi:hypothetical protein